MLNVGDIGGTKTLLALYELAGDVGSPVAHVNSCCRSTARPQASPHFPHDIKESSCRKAIPEGIVGPA